MRKCTVCKEIKTFDSFYRDLSRKEGYSYTCKECESKRKKVYRLNNLEQERIRSKRYKEANLEIVREKARKYGKLRRFQKYGLTKEDYIAFLEAQNFKCKICGIELKGSWNQANAPAIDHCHGTGRVRGILCNSCNKMIGHAYENQETLQNAINYLKEDYPEGLIKF